MRPPKQSCGSDCSENYTSGTSVTLTAAPASGSLFSGWGGACAGTGGCTVAMSAAKSVTATFTANSSPKIYQLSWNPVTDPRFREFFDRVRTYVKVHDTADARVPSLEETSDPRKRKASIDQRHTGC